MRRRGKFEAEPQVPAVKKHSKNKLLISLTTSIVSMVLCCTMLLGTTMAWFTDEVVSAGNQITIGTMQADVLFKGQSLRMNPNARMPAPKVFDSSFHWKPDHFEARSLTIQNSGSLDIQYVLNLLLETDDYSVAKYFDVYVYTKEGDIPSGTLDKDHRDGWEKVGNLADMFKGGINVLDGTLKADETLSGKVTSKTVGFALHMLPGANNEDEMIDGKTMTISIKLNAYQIDTPEDEMVDTTDATESTPTVETTEETVVETTTAITDPEEGSGE